jgi:hypothetical protein
MRGGVKARQCTTRFVPNSIKEPSNLTIASLFAHEDVLRKAMGAIDISDTANTLWSIS